MQSLLPGIHSMLNPHPLFVHFPLALWLAALLFELIAVGKSNEEWQRNAVRLLYLGTFAAILAVSTGWLAEKSVPEAGPAHEVMEIHEAMMLISTSVAMGLSLFAFLKRKKLTGGAQRLLLLGLIVLGVLLILGSDRGAQLVYQYATSVNLPGPPK
jgi:uncharacterized membrane protein